MRTSRIMAAVAATIMLATSATHAATTWYVSDEYGNNAYDGTNSWANAKKTIQAAINASSDGDTIWVDEGKYTFIWTDKAITIRSVNGARGIFDEPLTVIEGDTGSRCATLGGSTVLEGFVLQNGIAPASNGLYGRASYGGGSYGGTLDDCELIFNDADYGGGSYGSILNRCILYDNTATFGGGACDSTLNDCIIMWNSAKNTGGEAQGGGVHGGTLSQCYLYRNKALSTMSGRNSEGGGAYKSILNDCTLKENSASSADGPGNSYGGGSYAGMLTRCKLLGNECSSVNGSVRGGGAYSSTLSFCDLVGNVCATAKGTAAGGGAYGGTLNNCQLLSNAAAYKGLKMEPSDVSVNLGVTFLGVLGIGIDFPLFKTRSADTESWGGGAYGGTLNNCLLWKNKAYGGGGAHSSMLNNCTVVENTSIKEGGGTRECPTINNSIVRYNTSIDGHIIYNDNDVNDFNFDNYWIWDEKRINNSNIIPYDASGTFKDCLKNCTGSNPRFVDRANGDFRLLSNSPCINNGANTYATHITFDLDGNPRRNGTTRVDMGCYEYYAPTSVTVTFDAQDGTVSPASKSVTSGSAYGILPDPKRTGYTFTGWLNERRTEVTSSTIVRLVTAHTLCAQWIANTYTVTLNPNGGSGGTASVTATYGSPMPPAIAPNDRTGYLFQGYLDTSAANGGTQYYTATMGSARSWDKAQDTILYARWTGISVIVTFDGQGGIPSFASQEVAYDSTYDILPEAARTGYAFMGWFTEPNGGGTQITEDDTVATPSSHTLYAKWASTYIVTFDGQGGTPSPTAKRVTYDSGYGTLPAPIRAGYVFMGWFTEPDGGGTKITSSLVVTIASNHTLYAYWRVPINYYVDANIPSDSGDGKSWATAKRTIQAAVVLALDGDTVIVTNGTYTPISTDGKTIHIMSVNGAKHTIIDGGNTNRCATLWASSSQTNTVLTGFMLTNGSASHTSVTTGEITAAGRMAVP